MHPTVSVALQFVGRQSMNIFLFHTFIYYYWFHTFIYAPRHPLLIFLLLLVICLIVSWLLNRLRTLIHL